MAGRPPRQKAKHDARQQLCSRMTTSFDKNSFVETKQDGEVIIYRDKNRLGKGEAKITRSKHTK